MTEKELNEDELEEFVKDELDKDINQEETIDDERVQSQLGEMGFLWDAVTKKLNADSICFSCKKKIDLKDEKLQVLQATKTDAGVVAFLGVCEDCYTKAEAVYKEAQAKIQEANAEADEKVNQ